MLESIQNEFKKGNFDESKRLCLSTPNYIRNKDILNLLGLIELQSNNVIQAIKYFKLTLKINPTNVKTLNNIGHLLLRRKKNSFAINFLKKAIENDKKFFPAYLNLSIVLKNIKRHEESIQVIKKYLNIENCDHVIMNPPFHKGKKFIHSLGLVFLKTAKKILSKKGALWMVCNKELIYENSINDLFPNYKYIDITKNYKIIKAIKCY